MEASRGRWPFRGWLVVLGCAMVYECSGPGHTTGINAFVDDFIRDLGISRTSVSTTWFIASMASACSVPFAGWVFDRLGARRMIMLLAPTYVATLLSLSRVQSWAALTACVAGLRFLGPECCVLIATTTPQLWFVRHRGRANAVISVADFCLMGWPMDRSRQPR